MAWKAVSHFWQRTHLSLLLTGNVYFRKQDEQVETYRPARIGAALARGSEYPESRSCVAKDPEECDRRTAMTKSGEPSAPID